MTRAKKARRFIHVFEDGGKRVKCWLVIRDGEICFRKMRSRRVLRIGVREVYEHITGQITMPFV